MKNAHERIVKSIEREIKRSQERLETIEYLHIGLWEQAFPQAWISDSPLKGSIDIDLPLDFALIAEVREFIKTQFPEWKIISDRQYIWEEHKSAGHFLTVNAPAVKLKTGVTIHPSVELNFRSTTTGSTCVIRRIGSKRKTIPILEVVCPDGANENW